MVEKLDQKVKGVVIGKDTASESEVSHTSEEHEAKADKKTSLIGRFTRKRNS